jgi:23S rRNA G2445 N2-methylase RlmL
LNPFFARTTHGLEDVTADELRGLEGVGALAIEHRLVSGVTEGALAALCTVRTADDVFLELARFDGMERARAALLRLAERGRALDLRPALSQLAALRALPARPSLSLTASFVGRRNYTSDELKQTLAEAVAGRHGLEIEADDRKAALNLRLVLEHARARIGLRLSAQPLHERPWKRAHAPGSLKPSVAAALWRLGRLRARERALDPCCGAGTLVAEAAALGAWALGGDRDATVLEAAAANLADLGVPTSLVRWDVRSLPLSAAKIDCVASNLPWGRQVKTGPRLAALYEDTTRELARVLAPGARAVLLTGLPELLPPGTLRLEAKRQISLYGQHPSVVILARDAEAA